MRKWTIIATLALILLGAAPSVNAMGWGVGGFGGVSIPIVQKDASRGYVAGVHLKLSLVGLLGIEPNVTFFRNGDWTTDDVPGVTFKGAKYSAVGVNLILGSAGPVTGFRFFPFIGAKYYSESAPDISSKSQLGWNAGLGLEVGFGSIGIEARASGELMKLDGGASRKWGHITGGLNYYFGIL